MSSCSGTIIINCKNHVKFEDSFHCASSLTEFLRQAIITARHATTLNFQSNETRNVNEQRCKRSPLPIAYRALVLRYRSPFVGFNVTSSRPIKINTRLQHDVGNGKLGKARSPDFRDLPRYSLSAIRWLEFSRRSSPSSLSLSSLSWQWRQRPS